MSYDLYFWRETASQTDPPDVVCARLCEEEEDVQGVAWLPVAEIKAAFTAAFPGIEESGTELNWEGAGSHFQVTWPTGSKPQHTLAIIVTCGYELLKSPETMNRLIDVAARLGCALYDRQTGDRYQQPDQPPG